MPLQIYMSIWSTRQVHWHADTLPERKSTQICSQKWAPATGLWDLYGHIANTGSRHNESVAGLEVICILDCSESGAGTRSTSPGSERK